MEIGQPAKMVEKVGYKGQQAAHLGLVIQSYIQQSLGNLLQYMQLNEYDKEKAVQKVRHFCILILENKTTILSLLYQLGFIVNKSKSQLVPVQSLTYIGSWFDLAKGFVYPTLERQNNLKSAVSNLFKGQISARSYLILLGMIASCLEMIPNARLFMRPIQLHLLQNETFCKSSTYSSVNIGSEVVVTGSEHCHGQTSTERPVSSYSDHRCQWQMGMGVTWTTLLVKVRGAIFIS